MGIWGDTKDGYWCAHIKSAIGFALKDTVKLREVHGSAATLGSLVDHVDVKTSKRVKKVLKDTESFGIENRSELSLSEFASVLRFGLINVESDRSLRYGDKRLWSTPETVNEKS